MMDCAFIRELHTYGHLVPIDLTPTLSFEEREKSEVAGLSKRVQHTGFGKQLMEKAEEIVKNYGARPVRSTARAKRARRAYGRATSNGVKKIAVIAGVGVRPYYEKLGYTREGTYMVKMV